MPHRFPRPWEFYAFVKDVFSVKAIVSAHSISQTQAYRYACNSEKIGGERNPADALEALLTKCVEEGGAEGHAAALGLVERFAAIVGRELAVPATGAGSGVVEREVADILPAVGDFARACMCGAPRAQRTRAVEKVVTEVMEAHNAADIGQVFACGNWRRAKQ